MQKIILITGATDGIGFETARMLVSQGHHVLLHGRNPDKLKNVQQKLSGLSDSGRIESYVADLSRLSKVKTLAETISQQHTKLDVIINNAGVYRTENTRTQDGLDVRFAVNTVAPYLLTKRLLPLLDEAGRVINLSSAAQARVSPEALAGKGLLSDSEAYAQSKLALTMWSRHMGLSLKDSGPVIVAVNPKSLLGSKMVKDAYGIAGGDLSIGADILCRAALSDEFAVAHGQYFDNDAGQFSSPHPEALDAMKVEKVVVAIEGVLTQVSGVA
ncbi:SDR family NAD(P)-dependent oxidoreductase [Endozoicomonadaceae bacterium StTr2]